MVRRIGQALVGIAIVFGVWFGAHAYVWTRLAEDTALPAPGKAIVGALLGTLALLVFVAFARVAPRPVARIVHDVSFHWMGVLLLVVTMLGLADLLAFLLGRFAYAAGDVGGPIRIARLEAGIAGGGALALVARSLWNGRKEPPLERVTVSLAKLPAALSGLRIVQISDLHVDHATNRADVERLVARVNALTPDVVALTGDLVDGTPSHLADSFEPLRNLRARLGVFAVTGNHEYYSNADGWIRVWREMGFRVLQNEHAVVEDRGARFVVAGVPDWRAAGFGPTHRPRLKDALDGRDESLPVVLLAHQPRQFREAVALGVDLQLSGHTHGGQIWPFSAIVRVVEPYFVGLVREGASQLYVSRGTGSWGPRMRLGSEKELTELTLVAG